MNPSTRLSPPAFRGGPMTLNQDQGYSISATNEAGGQGSLKLAFSMTITCSRYSSFMVSIR